MMKEGRRENQLVKVEGKATLTALEHLWIRLEASAEAKAAGGGLVTPGHLHTIRASPHTLLANHKGEKSSFVVEKPGRCPLNLVI